MPPSLIIRIVDFIAWLRPIAKLSDAFVLFAYVLRSTALHAAAYFGNLPAANLLLERGADVNSTANPKGMTPLILAAIGGHDDVVARLLAAGASPGAKDKRGRTALSYAEKLGRDAVRRRLLNAATEGVPASAQGVLGPLRGPVPVPVPVPVSV